jgi:hypothetical protein
LTLREISFLLRTSRTNYCKKHLILPSETNFREKNRGITMAIRKREESDNYRDLVGSRKKPMKIAVVARQQTLEEERKCTAAIHLLLTELVRQQLGCTKEKENV